MQTLLISTYDLGRQPFGLASAAAALRAAGIESSLADLSRERLSEDAVMRADAVAFFLPMHTATRLALPVIDRVRRLNPRARLCGYGLYAPLNASLLRERGVTTVIGGEFEDSLVAFARGEEPRADAGTVPRVEFRVPDRRGLPVLSRYATLHVGREQRIVAYTEASRGCKHRCRHCPIVPVYDGRFRVVPVDVVMADVRAQVDAGATHVTFGDPDFFNGIKHADAVIAGIAREFPGVTYDVTIKVEHLLAHAEMLPRLHETGCAFVTSAVESIDDEILGRLEKGHTRQDFERVTGLFRDTGLTLEPTFVPFTPWTTLEGYCDLLQTIDRLQLVDHVAPIQLAIRLLITEGSRLLELDEIRSMAQRFDAGSLTYRWQHPDPRVDALQAELMAIVGTKLTSSRREMFESVWTAAHRAAGVTAPARQDILPRAAVPYLNEPWYC
ncbi:MAG TPA: CUAEP/CCAEP-tail radical SAM protein [Vicinamibacterales bacterium]|jgi:radical SAM superfamily enzyme YgiQ (UPF0313 family)|nr:CUAEP/CCAEP-tail radical SAM protein [Vicinamibacterales bacterium]